MVGSETTSVIRVKGTVPVFCPLAGAATNRASARWLRGIMRYGAYGLARYRTERAVRTSQIALHSVGQEFTCSAGLQVEQGATLRDLVRRFSLLLCFKKLNRRVLSQARGRRRATGQI